MPDAHLQRPLSESEAAELLGVGEATLRRYRRRGEPLCAFVRTADRAIRYYPADVAAAIAARRVAAAPINPPGSGPPTNR